VSTKRLLVRLLGGSACAGSWKMHDQRLDDGALSTVNDSSQRSPK